MSKRLGFIGLGQMGKWMAANLLKAGYDVTVLSGSRAFQEFLAAQGAHGASAPAELAASTDIVFLCLPDTDVVESVVFGPGGVAEGARPGLVVIDLSTISYRGTLEIGRRLEEIGVPFADAPISGMEARAKDATLTVMFGGDEALFSDLMPYFEAIGNDIIHMGKAGSGQLAKLINQLLFNTAMASLAELLPMAAKLGLDPEKITRVATTGTGRSFGLEFFAPRILENRFDEGYPLAKAYKDMVSAAEISAHQHIPLPMVQAATTTFQLALAEGLGEENKGALIKVYERLLGVQFRRPD